jgi:hypothetical protein
MRRDFRFEGEDWLNPSVLPFLRPAHPLWLDTFDVTGALASWCRSGQRILWLCSRDSLFSSILKDCSDPTSLLMTKPTNEAAGGDFFDACLCELSPSELTMLPALHRRIRTLVRNGGKVVVHINNPYLASLRRRVPGCR